MCSHYWSIRSHARRRRAGRRGRSRIRSASSWISAKHSALQIALAVTKSVSRVMPSSVLNHPRRKQTMLKFYFSGAPNPTKVALFLEETGLPYDPIAVDTRRGEQHKPDFLAINPNAKL